MAPDAINGPDDVQAPKFLTDVILELGYASEEQVKKAVEAARLTNSTAEQVLLDNGEVTEEQIGRAVAERNGIEYIDLSTYQVDPVALEQVTPVIARRIAAVPIAFAGTEALVVAIANPAGGVAAGEIAAMTRLRVQPVVAAKKDIDALIERIPERSTSRTSQQRERRQAQVTQQAVEQQPVQQQPVQQTPETEQPVAPPPDQPVAPPQQPVAPMEGDMMEQVMRLADPDQEVDLSPDLKLVHDGDADAAAEAEMQKLRADLAKMLELEQDMRTTIMQVGERLKRTGIVAGSERVVELEDQLKASEDARAELERERDELKQRLAAIRNTLGGQAAGG